MTHFLSTSLNQAGPCFSEKGKAKEILFSTAPPSWYPVTTDADNDELKLEGAWWSVIGKDEGYLAGLPVVPTMPGPSVIRKRRIPGRNKRRLSMPNGIADLSKPPRISSAPVSLEKVVHRSVDKLSEARRVVGQIQDFQRIEAEGGVLPVPNPAEEEERRERNKQERIGRKRRRKAEFLEAKKRRKTGGEIGETEAVMALKRTTASMLAHSGFEGELPYFRGGIIRLINIAKIRCQRDCAGQVYSGGCGSCSGSWSNTPVAHGWLFSQEDFGGTSEFRCHSESRRLIIFSRNSSYMRYMRTVRSRRVI